jgi:hypothetical protein
MAVAILKILAPQIGDCLFTKLDLGNNLFDIHLGFQIEALT